MQRTPSLATSTHPPADLCTVPLVVDLDGTLLRTDTLHESALVLLKRSVINPVRMLAWLLRGRSALKSEIASRVDLQPEALPWNEDVLGYLREQKAAGRTVILATAAHRSIADMAARHLGVFDGILATTADVNLKGRAKLEAIQAQYGNLFDYAGDSRADIPIWREARVAITVNVPAAVMAQVRPHVPVERAFDDPPVSLKDWARALRVHQWLKNLLIFVPALTAFSMADPATLIRLAVAFLAFSLAASATYILNDLWDLTNDRAHPRKRNRPFASGRLRIPQALAACAMLLLAGLATAALLSPKFLVALLLYLAMTSAYSWVLKQYVLLDVIMLSMLYTLRIIAGAMASGIPISSWLLAFSGFLFLSLALVKRCSELITLGQMGRTASAGRDYRVADNAVLIPLGVGAALSAVVVFGLFVNAPETRERYGTPEALWGVALALTYWLGRLWIKTSRGEMHDDPIVYALRDHGSRLILMIVVGIMVCSHYFRIGSMP